MKRKLHVGFDFDGVIAYNPFRTIRAPVSYIKRNIFGETKLKFYYPQKKWQQIFWRILHDSSVFPAKGIDLLSKMVKEDMIEAHLITGRYNFLDDHLDKWLRKNKIKGLFQTININKNNDQPHLFKEKTIMKYKLNMFIEDNWDIVNYLTGKKHAQIYWIYNIFDRGIDYKNKFPYLEKALVSILESGNDRKS